MNTIGGNNSNNDDDDGYGSLLGPPAPLVEPLDRSGGIGNGLHNINNNDSGIYMNRSTGSAAAQRAQQMRRYQNSSNMIQNQMQARAPTYGPFGGGWALPDHHQIHNNGNNYDQNISNNSGGFAVKSKLISSLICTVVVILILYSLTPAFVTLPANKPLEIPHVSHVHVLLLGLASGIITFILQYLI